MAVNVSRETEERLRLYARELFRWNQSINLIGRHTEEDGWRRHFLDSMQLYPLLDPDQPSLDLGSGAGFPGMVLAIMGCREMHLVESDQRKVAFLRHIAIITHTPVEINAMQIEELLLTPVSTVLSRACAPLKTLLKLSQPFLGQDSICIFPKGKNHAKEIADARAHWTFECEVLPAK